MPGCFRALILHIAASITSSAATQVLQSVSVCKDHLAWIGHQQDLNKEFTGSNFPPCWRRGLKRGSLDPSWWDWRMCGSYQVTLSKMLLGQTLNFSTQPCLQTRLVSSSCLGKGPSALVWHLFISWLGYGLGQVCREKGLVKLLCILCHPLSPCRAYFAGVFKEKATWSSDPGFVLQHALHHLQREATPKYGWPGI